MARVSLLPLVWFTYDFRLLFADLFSDMNTVSVRVPRSVPSGEYLLRVEHIALHSAGKPQVTFGQLLPPHFC
jgi:hypothetical protein